MSTSMTRVPVVAVIGSAGALTIEVESVCHELGDALMEAGFRLVTGGRGGVMEAVSRGARESDAWREGRIVAILPSYRHSEANAFSDVVIPTGLQLARNVLVVASADVVIAVDGGAGTLSEVALAWQLERPVIALGETGWAGKLAGERIDGRSDKRVLSATSAESAVALSRELAAGSSEAGDIGSGWRSSTESDA